MSNKSNPTFIDADSIVFYIGSAYDNPKTYKSLERSCKRRVDNFIKSILEATRATHYIGFIGDAVHTKNFRYDVAVTAPYKGKRGKPLDSIIYWEPIIKTHMIEKWGFIPLDTIEADDAVIICAKHYGVKDSKGVYKEVSIASPDKDLDQFPCKIYNYGKHEYKYPSVYDSNYSLCKQMLIGDTCDGIPGLHNTGPVAADKILKGCKTYKEMMKAVWDAYVQMCTITIHDKAKKKSLDDTLLEAKEDLGIKRWTKKLKIPVVEAFDALWDSEDHSDVIMTREQILDYIREQIALVRMLREPAYGFEIPDLTPYVATPKEVKTSPKTKKITHTKKVSQDDIDKLKNL